MKKNREKVKIWKKREREKYSIRYAIYKKLYNEKNREKINEKKRIYLKNKRKNNIEFKLKCNILRKVNFSILKNFSSKTLIKYLPYTIKDLKNHIEFLWEPWMNWENYGKISKIKKTWQIDHIIPQSKLLYDSLDHPNFQKCWALENLRPLEAFENIKKGNK